MTRPTDTPDKQRSASYGQLAMIGRLFATAAGMDWPEGRTVSRTEAKELIDRVQAAFANAPAAASEEVPF